jgi:uncharacterized membrane protein (UPF0136 family)
MEEHFSPQQSLALITQVIQQAKQKVERDDTVYMFWGLLIAVAALGQYFMLQVPTMRAYSFLPYCLMPVGSLLTWWYYSKKAGSNTNNLLQNTLKKLWVVISINLYILGFVLFGVLGAKLIPIILLLLGMGFFITAWTVQSAPLQFSGLLMNIVGLVAFYVPLDSQPLCLAGVAFVGGFLVGGYLRYQKQKSYV